MIKKCTKCSVEKPFSEFNKAKRAKTGLRSECKSCENQYQRQYYQENKEKIAEAQRQYYQNNKEKIAEYRQENKEKITEAQRQYRQENKEKIAEKKRQYRQENKEKIAEKKRQYRQENKEKIAEYQREYQRQYRENNKEKVAEGKRQYRQDNKEKIAEYRQENKEKIAEQWSRYYQENKEKIVEKRRQYYQNMTAGIYQIINTKTGAVYIGCSTQIPRRWREHKTHLKKNKHDNKLLQKAYNEYGLEGLKFEVIKEYSADTPFKVLEREETKLILEHKTKGIPMYNLSIKINSIDENHLTL